MKQKASQLEATQALWKLCFEDSKEFTELYFNLRYKDEINNAIYEDGQMVAALQMIPYPMTFCNHIIPTSYISGACTHPDYRNQGLMKKLLTQAFIHMYNDGILLSTLIPAEEWLFDYYTQSGYTPTFDYSTETIDVSTLTNSADYSISLYSPDQADIYDYLQRKFKEHSCCILHTMEDFKVILADLELGGGKLFAARHNKKISGLAFCIPGKEEVYFSELLYDTPEARDSLLKEASTWYKFPYAQYITSTHNRNTKKLGMARIINAPKMLQLYADQYKNIHLKFKLSDKLLPLNNGFYQLGQGTCKQIDPPDENCTECTINQLTQALMGYHTEQLPEPFQSFPTMNPYMSLMLN